MRLTRLRLNGFKSFADPTELLIAPGLTGVVGPNGCGKSNLLEALRWVMGETRPSQMRGGGMEDVIFAGTTRRGPRAQAEVALHFERDGQEVELVRRIARDGGSTYRLGGREARARDVQVMFADAASGAQSPALVRQGQISELIGQKPVARRRVIEEAAGVAGLQARRGEASGKLAAAEGNLQRVSEVTEELAQRLRALERQARNARTWQELAAAIRMAEGQLLWRAWAAAEEALASAEGEARTRGAQAARAEDAARQATRAREAAELTLPALRLATTEAGQAVTRAEAASEALAEEAGRAARRVEELRAAAAELARDSAREDALAAEAAGTLVRLQEETHRLTLAGHGEEERITAAATAAEEAGAGLRAAEAVQAAAGETAARVVAEAEAAERRAQELSRARDRADAETSRAVTALAEAEAAQARAEGQGRVAGDEAREAQSTLVGAEEALASAEAALGPAEEAFSFARKAAVEAEAQAAGLATEARTLARLVAADAPRDGQVGEGLWVSPGLEAAVAVALGSDLRAPLAAQGSGWTRLPPYQDVAALPAGVTPLSELLVAPPELARRLSQVGLSDASEAERLWASLRPGQRIVTREGDLWRWDGLRTLAADAGEAAAEAEALRRAARLPLVESAAAEEVARAVAARARQDAAASALSRARASADSAREARRMAERRTSEAQRAVSRAEADRALAQARSEAAREALARAQATATTASQALSEALAHRSLLPDPRDARAKAADAGAQVAAARSALLMARSTEDEHRRAAAARTRRFAELAREDGVWRGRAEAAHARAADLSARRGRLDAEQAEVSKEPERLAGLLAAMATSLQETREWRDSVEAELRAAEAVLQEAQAAEREAERQASDAREARAGAEASRAAAADRMEATLLRLREDKGQTPRELLGALGGDARIIPPEGTIQAELVQLRRRRDNLGAVNLRAEEDARALREEREGLLHEAADLSEAVTELRRALAALNREGRERMVEAFGRVNAEFGRLFRHLFGGGEARLTWVEGDDPLEAGVEIMAQPPGKTLGTLSLLSGGEQTLTALALIFAVFLVAPAPVCVLDEVDAPLDDANVGRFCGLLDAMARETETRFLVITHHAVTMARMDRLFGVTMAERGVSQLVSVDLRAAESLVA